jgi:FdhD protein
MSELPPPLCRVARDAWVGGTAWPGERALAEETPVAFTYDGATHAVMMATPADLTDFAFGFSLTEGIVATAAGIAELEIVPLADGVDLRMWLAGCVVWKAWRRPTAGSLGSPRSCLCPPHRSRPRWPRCRPGRR